MAEKTFTKIFPGLKALANSPRMTALDLTTLFDEHGVSIPYATMYNYYRKATGAQPIGRGIPKTVASKAKEIWASYRDANPELFGLATPTEDGVVAYRGPEKEGPSQMEEQLSHILGGDTRAKSKNWQYPHTLDGSESLTPDEYELAETPPTMPVGKRDGYLELEMPDEDVMHLNSLMAILRIVAPGGVKTIRIEY